jgi:acyl-coenzyme A thioesterase PaaI-like protein
VDPTDRRERVAALLRDLGHDFVRADLSDDQLDALATGVDSLLAEVLLAPSRARQTPRGTFDAFLEASLFDGPGHSRQLFADSMVSGHANPMGLAARLWREGDAAVMEVSLGAAFEGAPGRSHGGAVAALIDETMGVAMGIHGVLAFTARLTITYRAPTPVGQPVRARAWLAGRDGRKLTIVATVESDGELVAEGEALFIEVDPATLAALD